MDKKSIKNSVLVVIFVVLAPLILVGLTALGNTIGIKGNPSSNATQTTEKAAKVPEETKSTTNNDIPKADDKKISNNTSSNNKDKNQNSGTVSSTPIAGQSYVVKTGDTLFTIASSAYAIKDAAKNFYLISLISCRCEATLSRATLIKLALDEVCIDL